MKKLPLLPSTLLLISISSFSFGQSWLWGREGYGSLKLTNAYGSAVATDENGNAYIGGVYSTTIIFGNDTLTCSNDNGYLAKYDQAGNVIWAEQMIDSSGSYDASVTTDKSGNVYATGRFSGTARAGSFTLMDSIGNISVFLAKYNPGGTALWAKQGSLPVNSGNSFGEGYSVATDKQKNVFITGYFQDTISFGSYLLKSPYNGINMFIVKYDSNGNVLWANQSKIPTASSTGFGYSVATDNFGNAYVTGYFQDTLYLGSNSLVSGPQTSFLVKYSPSGSVLWAKQNVNNNGSSYCIGYSVITDEANASYITGYFSGNINFGSHALSSFSPTTGVFLAKYDTGGNAIWAKQSSPGWYGTGLASDNNKHIYMAGVAAPIFTFDSLTFNNHTFYSNPAAKGVSFIMKFDTSGNLICGSVLNNVGEETNNGVASDLTGTYVYTASVANDSIFCGPDTLLPKGGGPNTFIGRWQSCDNVDQGVEKITAQNGSILVYPNPSTGIFTLTCHSESSEESLPIVEVYNMLGEKVYTLTLPSGASVTSQINLSAQPNGIYLYRVTDNNGSLIGNGKLVIEK